MDLDLKLNLQTMVERDDVGSITNSNDDEFDWRYEKPFRGEHPDMNVMDEVALDACYPAEPWISQRRSDLSISIERFNPYEFSAVPYLDFRAHVRFVLRTIWIDLAARVMPV